MRSILYIVLVALCSYATAGPVINEFMASNQSIYPDNCDFDDYSDWIELYNPAGTHVALTDHYLTDDLTLPLKWKIPEGTVISADSYLMIRADGYNAAPGETYLRGYYPWSSTFITQRYHAGFKLSAGGESLGIYRITAPPSESTLIAQNATWKYRDLGTSPDPDWMKLTYNDSGWASGPAELGYGDGDEETEVSYGPDSNDKYPTTYFRHHFTVVDPSLLADVRCDVNIDDGAIFYLNGTEVARLRVTDGAKSYLDYSGYSGSDYEFERIDLPVTEFRAGDNVLAVEAHQSDADSSDLSLAVDLVVSEIDLSSIVLVDSVSNYPAQLTDVSYGRDPASTNGWSFFAIPTPESPNATETLTQFVHASDISGSLESGFYTGAQIIALSSAGTNETIRYTLDGSVPSAGSMEYSTALSVTNTTILRARSFAPGKLPGALLTRTLFVNEISTLPTLSLVADPGTLFDDTIGIYENSSAYPYKGREVPIRLEMFEADQTQAFAVNAGTRIAGENIWLKAQKPFNIYMRSRYGDDLINYQMFSGQPVASFGEINLRNGGDDWEESLLRDAMIPSIVEGQMDAGLYSYRPSILFLNGDFWGIYNIRKRFDETYFATEHALPEGEYDLVRWSHVGTGTTVLNAEEGSTEAYEDFLAYCTMNDPSDPSIYSQIKERMNVDSFIDYVVGTDYAVNTSWSHNREFWCAHAPGSQWQWIVNDFDRGFSAGNVTGSIIDNFRSSYTLFQRLDNNTNFVNRLIQRYAAHLGSTFYPQRISDRLELLAAEQSGEIQRHIDRWGSNSGIPSIASWQAELDEIKQFSEERPAYALSRLQTELGLSYSIGDLTVNVSPSGGGAVWVAGVPMTPEYNNVFSLFLNVPVELTATPLPGYSFGGWSTGNTNRTIEITMTGAETITAMFVNGAETIVPSIITSDTTLTILSSPYSVTNDLIVTAGSTLTLEPGVKLLMPAKRSIVVNGALNVNGTEGQPVEIRARDGKSWGNLSFVDATGNSTLNYVTIREATASRHDPLNLKAAVSGFNSSVTLNHADIEALQPIFARYGSTILRNSTVHILFTGDGINIKSGDGLVENSTFLGNQAPDTDAIDFDNVVGGAIHGNRIYAFLGPNSDAIDVGEGCRNLMVVSNRIFNITDKGVSVGQASVAHIEHNLIVDCDMGVGVKDAGSTAYVDQNTFARVNIGVASFEKNAGKGGGVAYVSNCIFSRTKDEPVFFDALSTLTVDYSLSDTLTLSGTGNLLLDPLFTDAGAYDFSLTPESPALDAGDPAHALDMDASRADMGAYYTFNPEDYPYFIPNLVVINEVLARSHGAAADWIELLNSSSKDIDLGGWYLSDDPDVPLKYRIADGTILPANGYIVFNENLHFGFESADPGADIPFALSENGDTVHVFGPGNNLRPDYTEQETFGASLRNVTMGRYYKTSTRTYNFVSMATPTPGAANSEPQVGPVVISEIMYQAPNGEADYVELTNIAATNVTLHDADIGQPWRITKGFDHVFPSAVPLVMAPGEKILLVRNLTAFSTEYGAPAGTQIYQWDSGNLDNGGETLELSLPGDTNRLGELQFIRIDRVDYNDKPPWPTGPDGSGTALARIDERAYGNDVANWRESAALPGETGFQQWQSQYTFPVGEDGPGDDPDDDGISTALEYATGTDPTVSTLPTGEYALFAEGSTVSFILPTMRPDVGYVIQKKDSLQDPNWINLSETVSVAAGQTAIAALDPDPGNTGYFRLVIILYNQY